jgi:hypothetical protein
MRDDWKSLKIAVLEMEYGKKADEWYNLYPPVSDDRRVYINIYHQLIDAVKSLTDNPNTIVCVAMNRYINEEKKTLDEIKKGFC